MRILYSLLIFFALGVAASTSHPPQSTFNKKQILDYVIEEFTLKEIHGAISSTQDGHKLLDVLEGFEDTIQKVFESKLKNRIKIYLNVGTFESELTDIKFQFLGSQSFDFDGFHIYESVKNYTTPYLLNYYYPETLIKYWEPRINVDYNEGCCLIQISEVEISLPGHRAAVHASNSCYLDGYPILFLFEQYKKRWLPYASIVDKRT